jgi:FkbM family methyltransferase
MPVWLPGINRMKMPVSKDNNPAPLLDPNGFNELRLCRSGPMIYNKFDIFVGGSLQKYREFSIQEQELFRQVIRPGSLAVEVGANIGAHTVDIARFVGQEGEVHAFEPQRLVFQTLCANLALNQCANVHAKQLAVGAELGTILVPAMDPSVRTNFGGVSLVDIPAGESVPVVTLDSLDLPACHVIKVDVEGMEAEVIKGANRTIDSYRPIMYLENDREERSEELLTLVLSLDYKIYWHLPRLFNPDNFAGETEDIFPGIVSVNIFCVPKEVRLSVTGMKPVLGPTDSWRG